MKKSFLILVFGALWAAVAVSLVSIQPDLEIAEAAGQPEDPLLRVLGTTKEALGDMIFLQADSYLHGGLRPDLIEATRRVGETYSNESYDNLFKNLMSHDWAGKIYSQVGVTEHRHLHGEQTKELLPLLAVSTSLDPHNISAVLTAAHWIGKIYGDQDEAIHVLENARKENKDSWEIDFSLGQIYFEDKKNNPAAVYFFKSAVKKMDRNRGLEYTFFDPIRVRYYLAEAYFKQNLYAEALTFYRQALAHYPPGRQSALKDILKKKIMGLEKIKK